MKHRSRKPAVAIKNRWQDLLIIFLIILVVVAGAYLRLVGVNWDEDQHMHPDERFLSLVQMSISPVNHIGEYFNTAESSLNPANRGHTFFVYGTLPIFIVRYLGEALQQTDYNAITLLGRQVSAIFDLITFLLISAIGWRLYNKWVGLLAGLFYALAVLPIQLSHFATVDTITNTFAYLAVFAAVWIITRSGSKAEAHLTDIKKLANESNSDGRFVNDSKDINGADFRRILIDLAPYILFGIGLGAATASKINAVVFALVLPLAVFMRYLKMNQDQRRSAIFPMIRNLVVAGIVSFIVFRIGQPYAFNGPGFFNFGINENWWLSLQNLRAQASGNVDFPPALQWARRPLTFSWENLVAWGLGWPLGLTALIAYFGMGYMIFRKRNWHCHLPLWLFTGLHFIWQSFSWVRSMRYQMLIYPALALFASWGLVKLWSVKQTIHLKFIHMKPKLIRVVGILLTLIVILTTSAWAFAFSGIYRQPHPRVSASRWIYQNIPGALTLEMEIKDGALQQPLPYRAGDTFSPDAPYSIPFYAEADGVLEVITFPHILDQSQTETMKQVLLTITPAEDKTTPIAAARVESVFLPPETQWKGAAYDFYIEPALEIKQGHLYYIRLNLLSGAPPLLLNGSPTLTIRSLDGITIKSPLPRIMQGVRVNHPYSMSVQVVESGTITAVNSPFLVDQSGVEGLKNLTINLQSSNQQEAVSVSGQSEFAPGDDIRGEPVRFELKTPMAVEAGTTLIVSLETDEAEVRLVPHAPAPAHESSWDDAIPYPVDGFSPYSESGGIYRGDLNFEMYWADDLLKLEKFEFNLDLADYIFITSNRQWGTTTRVPERYLLTTTYYRELLGCPADTDLLWCYRLAEPGMFEGKLGFDLIEVFHSNPKIGPIEFNTQFAEEAFTVYDHPKVFIFQKADSYDSIDVKQTLRSVDLSKVVYFTPGEAASYQGPSPDQIYEPHYNLMLPEERLAQQRIGGTWSDLFDRESLINRSQVLAAVFFYLFIFLLGLLAYPVVRLALPGLSDRGYPLAKLAGLLLMAFTVWILGSIGVSVTPAMIFWVLVGFGLISSVFIFIQKDALWGEIKENWRYFLAVEILALLAFIFFLLIRLGNPDLWHPYKGGEKPMDFSYLNAVLKSTTFPPYDPWFAGGYINYYYYGFVIVGIPIKLLGIVPSVAYNLILPVWYSLLILASFSVGWNLYQGLPRSGASGRGSGEKKHVLGMAFWVGLFTAAGLALLGNLGTIRLIINGFQRIASGGAAIDGAAFGEKIQWALQGFTQFIKGTPMPFYPGDWYWFPSRVIPGEPITEFPYFSFIYGDLHAHLIALPITVFAISWSLSVVLNKARWGEISGRLKWLGCIVGFIMGALVIGALRPTNTWDFYTYLVLAVIALVYSIFSQDGENRKLKLNKKIWLQKILKSIIGVLVLVVLAFILYQPFAYWFGQGYTRVEIWKGDRTPLSSYFTHWGYFLFVIISWMGWETYHWMKTTPLSALKRLEPYLTWLYAGMILILVSLLIFLILGVSVALIALPVGVWAVILMLRPGRSDGHRFLLFMIGTGITLTLVVELIYLPGDIGRMNTVFKFYLQAWILLALSTGVCLGWLIKSLRYWHPKLEFFWQAILFVLIISSALFTLMGTTDKIRDRMAPEAPISLDGMTYMAHATHYDLGVEMQLEEDYQAIIWMQENIKGSPVILEGQAYEYRWGNRFTIYTGLPGVVGWNWHQRQQRAVLRSNVVQERVDAVNTFYTTEDVSIVIDFIEEYDVSYIVVGQLERIFYPGIGLEKFQLLDGSLWETVYRSGSTVIYKVLK